MKERSSDDQYSMEHGLHELTLVNPCHAAPTPMVELQPFSSRTSRKDDFITSPSDHRTFPTIAENGGSDEKGSGLEGGEGHEGPSAPVLSKARMFLVASGMLLTYFLGVSRYSHLLQN
jgi:hypothetical protein